MSNALRIALLPGLVFAFGCSAPPQVLTGRIAPGFPTPITAVKVTTSSMQSWHGDALVTTAPVAADGSFRLAIPPMSGVRLQLIGANGRSVVVFPRHSGSVAASFAIRANGVDFDLGRIRYVGDANTTVYTFKTATDASGGCNDDGKDANGATCVDDSDSSQNTCGQNDNNQQDGQKQDDQTGNAGAQDGNHQDGDQTDSGDGADMGDAVAEHNFPVDGCADDQGDDHQDGTTDGTDNSGSGND